MKRVQARNGIRHTPDVEAKLAHELADCPWCILVLANRYGIDLERAFLTAIDELESALASRG
jgi:NTP pyrophosphatase (non-canonical NTP hydrolase)